MFSYIRNGFFVRSPVRFNGVEIGEADRRKYEAEFLKRTEARERRGQLQAGAPGFDRPASDLSSTDNPDNVDGLLRQVREPQFVSSAYFLRFKFEEGTYALVGRETLDGHEVMRVEYYPSNLYSDRQRRRMARDHDPKDSKDVEIQRMMNKVALVTLWIEPNAHQIVKYTFDNIDFDFLPAKWLVRLDSVRATMTMSRPFQDVWLPRDLEFLVNAQIATGRFDIRWAVGSRLSASRRDIHLPRRAGTLTPARIGRRQAAARAPATSSQQHFQPIASRARSRTTRIATRRNTRCLCIVCGFSRRDARPTSAGR
jgi:hypothetical protein